MKKQKRILVSFSGGLDSTYLIYDNLKKGDKVSGLYTTILNNENKVTVEKFQVDKIVEVFNKEFPDQFTLEQGIDIMVYGGCDLHLKQIMIWVMSALYQGASYDEVHLGAVMNDDLISYIDDVKKTWKSFSFLSDDLPKLRFPLVKTPKYEIVRHLPVQYKELVVYCENPRIIKPVKGRNKQLVFENCGWCDPCKRYEYESKKHNYEYGQIHNVEREIESIESLSDAIPDIEDNSEKS